MARTHQITTMKIYSLLVLLSLPVAVALSGCASHDDVGDAPPVESPSVAPENMARIPMDCNDFAAGIGNGSITNCVSLIPGSYYSCMQGSTPVFNRMMNGVNICWSGSMY